MKVDRNICVSCGMCVSGFNDDKRCPADAIKFTSETGARIDVDKCIECGLCADLCALGAIE